MRRAGLLCLLLLVLAGCSVRRMAVNALADSMAGSGSVYARDNDPDLVKEAIPFGLKTMEGLLEEAPRHRGLLLAAASGFTQYSYAFVACEADYRQAADLEGATALRRRALALYLRARGYGLRGLNAGHEGFDEGLRADPDKALGALAKEDVPLLYWTAAAWGSAISLAKDNSELAADLSLLGRMMSRALELDEPFGDGALHDFFIAYDGGRPAAAGGSVERARGHLEAARRLSKGARAAPLVTFAETVSVGTQNRKEFDALLNEAVAIDPDRVPELRLANRIAQKRARWLLGRAEELFIE